MRKGLQYSGNGGTAGRPARSRHEGRGDGTPGSPKPVFQPLAPPYSTSVTLTLHSCLAPVGTTCRRSVWLHAGHGLRVQRDMGRVPREMYHVFGMWDVVNNGLVCGCGLWDSKDVRQVSIRVPVSLKLHLKSSASPCNCCCTKPLRPRLVVRVRNGRSGSNETHARRNRHGEASETSEQGILKGRRKKKKKLPLVSVCLGWLRIDVT